MQTGWAGRYRLVLYRLQEIGPYMLRREKKEVFKPAAGDGAAAAAAGGAGEGSGGAAQAAAGGGGGGGSKPSSMPHKNDLIVWLKLKPMQRRVYQAFLNSGKPHGVMGQACSWSSGAAPVARHMRWPPASLLASQQLAGAFPAAFALAVSPSSNQTSA